MTDLEFHIRLKAALKRHLTFEYETITPLYGSGEETKKIVIKYGGEEIDAIYLE